MSSLIPTDKKAPAPKKLVEGKNTQHQPTRQRRSSSEKNGGKRLFLSLAIGALLDGADVLFGAVPSSSVVTSVIAVPAFVMIWGWRWEMLATAFPETIPGVSMAPCWTILALYLGGVSGLPEKTGKQNDGGDE